MAERVVAPRIFANNNDRVGIVVSARIRGLVRNLCKMETLREVLGRYDYASLARAANKGHGLLGEIFITFVEADAGVDHLLLSEEGELICAEGVDVVREEGIVAGEVSGGTLDFLDGRVVGGGF